MKGTGIASRNLALAPVNVFKGRFLPSACSRGGADSHGNVGLPEWHLARKVSGLGLEFYLLGNSKCSEGFTGTWVSVNNSVFSPVFIGIFKLCILLHV